MVHRYHLGFVENHYAVGDVVEFPAAGGVGGIEGFKKLHHGGNYHRFVPVFGGQSHGVAAGVFPLFFLPLCRFGDTFFFINYAAVVLQYVFLPQNLPEFTGSLVDDGAVGDHIDHPLFPISGGMAQGKGQRRYRFASPGRHCQGKQPRRLIGSLQTLPQNGSPLSIDLLGGC